MGPVARTVLASLRNSLGGPFQGGLLPDSRSLEEFDRGGRGASSPHRFHIVDVRFSFSQRNLQMVDHRVQ